MKRRTVFVIDCAVVGPNPAQIVKSGVEIVMSLRAGGAFCADRLRQRRWFLCKITQGERGGFCVDTPLSTDRVPMIGAEPNAWKTITSPLLRSNLPWTSTKICPLKARPSAGRREI